MQDLAKAMQGLILEPLLHLVFMITPRSACELLPQRNWATEFWKIWTSLSVRFQQSYRHAAGCWHAGLALAHIRAHEHT